MTFTYDKKTARFRAKNGRFISAPEAKRRIEHQVTTTEKRFRATARLFNDGKISLPEFQVRMAKSVKDSIVATAGIGRGGHKQMSQSDWGKIGAQVREQNKFLNRRALAVEKGIESPAQLEYHASLYARPMRRAFSETQDVVNKEAGRSLSKRIRHALESCIDCIFWSRKGYIPIDEQPPIGSSRLKCRGGCKCEIVYQ